MNILAVETSVSACSVAMLQNKNLDFLYEVAPQKQADLILPMLEKLLTQTGSKISAMNAIAFGQGPGSFTGLRIAAAVSQGLALAYGLPLIGVSSLAALALAGKNFHPDTDYFLVSMDARMQQVYFALYEVSLNAELTAIIPDTLATPIEAASLIQEKISNLFWKAVGDGCALLEEFLPNVKNHCLDLPYPSAREVAVLASYKYDKKDFMALDEALPNYLRAEVIDSKK